MNDDSPLSGNQELRKNLINPERISSNSLRKYIATVSQVALLLLTVEQGTISKWKGKKLCDIELEDLPVSEIEENEQGMCIERDDTESCGGSGKKTSWTKSEERFLMTKFGKYLKSQHASVHKSDMLDAQQEFKSISTRTLAQIRTKLNNMKLGK